MDNSDGSKKQPSPQRDREETLPRGQFACRPDIQTRLREEVSKLDRKIQDLEGTKIQYDYDLIDNKDLFVDPSGATTASGPHPLAQALEVEPRWFEQAGGKWVSGMEFNGASSDPLDSVFDGAFAALRSNQIQKEIDCHQHTKARLEEWIRQGARCESQEEAEAKLRARLSEIDGQAADRNGATASHPQVTGSSESPPRGHAQGRDGATSSQQISPVQKPPLTGNETQSGPPPAVLDPTQTATAPDPQSVQGGPDTMGHTENVLVGEAVMDFVDKDEGGRPLPQTSLRDTRIRLEVHLRQARDSATASVAGNVIRLVVNTRESKPTAERIMVQAAEAYAAGFTQSLLTERMNEVFGGSASTVASSAVSATLALLHGNDEGAARALVEGAVNVALEQWAPVNFGRHGTVANGRLVGIGSRRVQNSVALSDDLSVNVAGVNVGVHRQRETSVYTRKGQTIHRQDSGVGAHGDFMGLARGSLTLSSGREVAEPVMWQEGELTFVQTWQREFKGEMKWSSTLGDRQTTVRVLPAWRSREVRWTFERRTDGKALQVVQNLPLQALAGPFSLQDATSSGQTPTLPEGQAAAPSGGPQMPQETVQPSEIALDRLSGEGRTEYILEKQHCLTIDKKVFGLSKRIENKMWEEGVSHEKKNEGYSQRTLEDGIREETVQTHEREQAFRDLRTEDLEKKRKFRRTKHYTNHFGRGERRENGAVLKDERVKTIIQSKEDGSALLSRTHESKGEGTVVTKTENEMVRVRTETENLRQPKDPIAVSSEVMGVYQTDVDFDPQTSIEGDQQTVTHKKTAEAGVYTDHSEKGRSEEAKERAASIRSVTTREDGAALASARLREKVELEGITGHVDTDTYAKVHETAVKSSVDVESGTSRIDTLAAVGAFTLLSGDLEVVSESVQAFESSQDHTLQASFRRTRQNFVVGSFDAQVAEASSSDLLDFDAALQTSVPLQERTLDDSQIRYDPKEVVTRFTDRVQAENPSEFLQRTRVADGSSGYSERSLVRRTQHQDHSKNVAPQDVNAGSSDSGVPPALPVKHMRIDEGILENSRTEEASWQSKSCLLNDQRTETVSEFRQYTQETHWETEVPANPDSVSPDSDPPSFPLSKTAPVDAQENETVGSLFLRTTQTVDTQAGVFYHQRTSTNRVERFDETGAPVQEKPAETKETQMLLSGGSARAAASLGSHLGAGFASHLEEKLSPSDHQESTSKQSSLTAGSRVTTGLIAMGEAFANGTAVEFLSQGKSMPGGIAIAAGASIAAEALRFATTRGSRPKEVLGSAEEKPNRKRGCKKEDTGGEADKGSSTGASHTGRGPSLFTIPEETATQQTDGPPPCDVCTGRAVSSRQACTCSLPPAASSQPQGGTEIPTGGHSDSSQSASWDPSPSAETESIPLVSGLPLASPVDDPPPQSAAPASAYLVPAACNIASNVATAVAMGARRTPVVGGAAAVVAGATAIRECVGHPGDQRGVYERVGDTLGGCVQQAAPFVPTAAEAVCSRVGWNAAAALAGKISAASVGCVIDRTVQTVRAVQAYRNPNDGTVTTRDQLAGRVTENVVGASTGCAAAWAAGVAGEAALGAAAATGGMTSLSAGAFAVVAPFIAAPVAATLGALAVRWLWRLRARRAEARAEEERVQRRLSELCAKYDLDTGVDDSFVKKKYRENLLKSHPDKQGGSDEKVRQVLEEFDEIWDLRSRLGRTRMDRSAWREFVVSLLQSLRLFLFAPVLAHTGHETVTTTETPQVSSGPATPLTLPSTEPPQTSLIPPPPHPEKTNGQLRRRR
uniref:J domain-containing protein n=1 Tax=Chromera velia CCMP2878 TaxID=1169474 RepID=A0A0G4GQL7_9ALVE|eukprot:Cvel_715.t1-p1 / transcript=Cvel_715.t1 / gene=Cvel_715 / organism=Chromera_velia_CCMP2878 / gene_product=hypothetical protein / transcript_product=hypothetical protein / location=Cvel_scaffold22:95731-101915(-) / protein_length=1784 / sequence_SO=supercontig / SO=protein_coding / is_pseudo=false